MKTTLLFAIGCSEINPKYAGLKHAKSFHRITELTGQKPCRNPAFLSLTISADDPSLPEVFKIIRDETGRIPLPRKMRRDGEVAKYFSVQVRRSYDEKDVCNLPYVRLHCTRPIANFKTQTEGECYVARADKRLKSHWEFGNLDPFAWAYAMNTRLKELLELEELKGFLPRPVLFDNPEKAAKQLWQPWSEVVMPRCLLPLLDDAGLPTTQDNLADPIEYTDRVRDPGRGVWYECGPYHSLEVLCYSASKIAALGNFDVAVAHERVGFTKRLALRALVISQRFRQLVKKEKLPGMQFIPVRLLKRGDPLWENPFESMIGPYDEEPLVADC